MNRQILYISLILISTSCFADQIKENIRNEIHLEKNDISIINVPYSRYNEYGKVDVINNTDSSIIYSLDFFLRYENYFSDDAIYHIQVNDWFLLGNSNQNIITFYKKGKVIKKLSVDDLNIQLMNLEETVSHVVWEDQSFLKENNLYVFTTNNELLVFDITKGKLIKHDKNISKEKFETLKNNANSYTISYSDYFPSIDSYKTNQNIDLDQILSDLVFKYYHDTTDLVWVGAYVFRNGSLQVIRAQCIDDVILNRKSIETISSDITNVKLTDIDFPNEYNQWWVMIKLEK